MEDILTVIKTIHLFYVVLAGSILGWPSTIVGLILVIAACTVVKKIGGKILCLILAAFVLYPPIVCIYDGIPFYK
ncbi:hypothetical protein Xvie_03560 [Xenorhabdus vietnamensis]|uniref:Uncharacterized protein n=1 Tax=Xenorhabdus vietnamensis TaxID=351656 RepID=A0A1Y2S7N8_9GAMM|nr:hypothetical protein [Xenorhabdus vietnamensis]OTA14623.1 hypothetical protein Xvie_03560 [Xenorhabdus vietnamensis]